MEPKISIIVPVYNSEKFLKRCIDSVLSQTHQNIEIILVNDGSIDKSSEICDLYAKKDNVKVEHIKNSGAGGARNVGLRLATGDYISFVDSDDWIHPEMLKTMLSTCQENGVSLVECDLVRVKSHLKIPNIENKYSVIIKSRIESLKQILLDQRFSVVVRLYKKELLNDIFFQENIMSEDVYFTLEVFGRISTLAVIPNKFYYYFLNTESVSKKPYSVKKLDTIDSALFIQNEILKNENDTELIETTRKFVMEILMINYTELQYNSEIDSSLKYRKQIKELIRKNYSIKDSSLPLILARFLPITIFNITIKMNSLMKKKLH